MSKFKKFKVGDKVIRTSSSSYLTEGDTYVVEETSGLDIRVTGGRGWWYSDANFELAPADAPKFKVGDRVRRVAPVPESDGIREGSEYTVLEVGKAGYEIKVEGSNYWFLSKYFDLIVAPSEEPKIKVGDRVRVTYEGTVDSLSLSPGAYIRTDVDGTGITTYAHAQFIEKIKPSLPTKPGSVIKVTKWGRFKNTNHILTLHTNGKWVHTAGVDYEPRGLLNYATEWEVVYDPS